MNWTWIIYPKPQGEHINSPCYQECDAVCEVIFYHDKVTVTKDSKDIAEGYRDAKTTFWRIPTTTPKLQKAHTNKRMRTPTAQINYVMPEGNMEEIMTCLHKLL